MLNDNSHSFFRLPKKVRKVSLCKRSSISRLHEPTASHQISRTELTDRRTTDRLENSKSRPVLVEALARHQSYTRYQWLTVLRVEFLKIMEQKGVRQVGKKTFVNIIQQHRYVTISGILGRVRAYPLTTRNQKSTGWMKLK